MGITDNLENALEKLIQNHTILGYEKQNFYFLQIPGFPFLEILIDSKFSDNLIYVTGESANFDLCETNHKKALLAHILTNNINSRIIDTNPMVGNWIFGAVTDTSSCSDATATFTYVAELPKNSTSEVIAEYISYALETFLRTRSLFCLFCDTPQENIKPEHLAFPPAKSDNMKILINPAFENFLKNFGDA